MLSVRVSVKDTLSSSAVNAVWSAAMVTCGACWAAVHLVTGQREEPGVRENRRVARGAAGDRAGSAARRPGFPTRVRSWSPIQMPLLSVSPACTV